MEDQASEAQWRAADRIAAILRDIGIQVHSPDDGDLDDRERELWDACLRIAQIFTH